MSPSAFLCDNQLPSDNLQAFAMQFTSPTAFFCGSTMQLKWRNLSFARFIEEILGECNPTEFNFSDFFYGQQNATLNGVFQEVVKSGHSHTETEFKLEGVGGKTIWGKWSFIPLRAEGYSDFDVCIVVENITPYVIFRKRKESLMEITSALKRGTHLREIVQSALTVVVEQLNAADGALYFLQKDGKTIRGEVEIMPFMREGSILELTRLPHYQQAVQERRPIFFTHAEASPYEAEICRNHEVSAQFISPIVYHDDALGILKINFSSKYEAPNSEDISFIEAVCILMALAINNIREREQILAYQQSINKSQKKSKIRIGDSYSYIQNFMKEAPYPLIVHADDGSILYVSRSWTELSGYSREDIPTIESFIEKTMKDNSESPRWNIEAFMVHDEMICAGEISILTRSGETRYWDFRTSLLGRLLDGRKLMISMAVDVTDRRNAENEIARLNSDLIQRIAELQTLFDVIPIGIAIADDPSCRYIRANRALTEMLGTGKDDNISLSPGSSTLPPYRCFINGVELLGDELPMPKSVMSGKSVMGMEMEIVRSDGRKLIVLACAGPLLDPEGQITGSAAAFVDITERKIAEEALEKHQKSISELNSRLQRAMTETHHRVKNNLQVIAAMIDMKIMDGGDWVPIEELRRLGAQIHALAAVHEILTRESVEDSQANSLSAKKMLENLLDHLQHTVNHRIEHINIENIRLSTKKSTSLALVTNELVSNASKHGIGGIDVSLLHTHEGLLLEISDNGPGFPANFSAENAARTGLDLVEHLSKWDLGGRVEYSNRPTGGACVRVYFSRDAAQ
jgi:PAS domain S-box-containing protein